MFTNWWRKTICTITAKLAEQQQTLLYEVICPKLMVKLHPLHYPNIAPVRSHVIVWTRPVLHRISSVIMTSCKRHSWMSQYETEKYCVINIVQFLVAWRCNWFMLFSFNLVLQFQFIMISYCEYWQCLVYKSKGKLRKSSFL